MVRAMARQPSGSSQGPGSAARSVAQCMSLTRRGINPADMVMVGSDAPANASYIDSLAAGEEAMPVPVARGCPPAKTLLTGCCCRRGEVVAGLGADQPAVDAAGELDQARRRIRRNAHGAELHMRKDT